MGARGTITRRMFVTSLRLTRTGGVGEWNRGVANVCLYSNRGFLWIEKALVIAGAFTEIWCCICRMRTGYSKLVLGISHTSCTTPMIQAAAAVAMSSSLL